jgi:hypothetical protein
MSSLKGELEDSIEKGRDALRRATEHARDWPLLEREPGLRREQADDEVRTGRQPYVVPDLHPFFRGLLDTLPEPGAAWPNEAREQWLETARNIFALIYKDAGPKPEAGPAPPLRLVEPEPRAVDDEPAREERSA